MTLVEPQPAGIPPGSTHFVNPWCEPDDIPPSRLIDSNGVPLTDIDAAFCISAATGLLYVLSGRQFRHGRSVVRPTSIQGAYGSQSYLYPYSSMSGYGSAWGFAAGWAWTAIGMGWWQNGQDLSECLLQGPVTKINSVTVDGNVLAPSQYTLYDRRRLVRNVDGTGASSGAWPWNQQLQLPVSSPGTWQIDYEWGHQPPPEGKLACIELAAQLALALSGQDACKLPARVITIATAGVTVGVGDALSYIREELTGIPIIDLFLVAHNPTKRRRPPAFIGPNSVQGRTS